MLGAEAREANKAWLMQQVNHVLEPLMLAIVREKLTNTVSCSCVFDSLNPKLLFFWREQIQYMVDHMEREYGERALNGDQN